MIKLKLSLRNNLILALVFCPTWLHAVAANGGNYTLTKTLIGSSGVSQVTSANYASAYAMGEDIAGVFSHGGEYGLVSGYFGAYASGFSGTFSLVRVTVGDTHILQDGIQIGVPLHANIKLEFSSPLDPATIADGIQMTKVVDHMGRPENDISPWTFNYDVTGSTLIISPQTAWSGNTGYEIAGNLGLRSIDGFALAPSPNPQFVTVLDPHEHNIVMRPMPGVAAPSLFNSAALSLDIPVNALSDYSYVLMNDDPINSPLLVNPQVVQEATRKAQYSGGAYQTPLAFKEIAAYNETGHPVSLSKASNFSIGYVGNPGGLSGSGAPIRTSSLSLWTLDTAHSLWVKMPDSQSDGTGVHGPVSQFAVYALMGSAEMNASEVFVFPVPWRPHGPLAGDASGETGTESGGITFSNLPSECVIKLYTLSGELVRELHHSDLAGTVGQEKWDVNTSGGDHVASGVYLWRVQSSSDSKNGKLMVIR